MMMNATTATAAPTTMTATSFHINDASRSALSALPGGLVRIDRRLAVLIVRRWIIRRGIVARRVPLLRIIVTP